MATTRVTPEEERRKCVLSTSERDELADLFASRVVDLFFSRISAAADKEESERIQAIGRRVDGLWRKWRWRILLPLGVVGVALAAGFHLSKEKILEILIKLLAGV